MKPKGEEEKKELGSVLKPWEENEAMTACEVRAPRLRDELGVALKGKKSEKGRISV